MGDISDGARNFNFELFDSQEDDDDFDDIDDNDLNSFLDGKSKLKQKEVGENFIFDIKIDDKNLVQANCETVEANCETVKNYLNDRYKDNTLPWGWKARGSGLSSPQGEYFSTKAKAIQHLMKNGDNMDLVEMLRNMYVADGWSRSNLPSGWLAKETPAQVYLLMAPDGTTFKGKGKAAAYLMRQGGSQEQCKQIQLFRNPGSTDINLISTERDQVSTERNPISTGRNIISAGTKNNDLTEVDTETNFLETGNVIKNYGDFLSNIEDTVSSMLRQNAEKDEARKVEAERRIAEVRRVEEQEKIIAENLQSVKKEMDQIIQSMEKKEEKIKNSSISGWKEDSNLPPGWKFRIKENSKVEFLSEIQIVFSSTIDAYRHIQRRFSSEDLDKFRAFNLVRMRSEEVKIKEEIESSDEIYMNENSESEIGSVSNLQLEEHPEFSNTVAEENFVQDSSLPSGWTLSQTSLLQPPPSLLLKFPSRRAAYQALAVSSVDPKEKERMFDKLAYEGWKASQLLPQGWIYQTQEGQLNFLSARGEFVETSEKFVALLRISGQYSETEIQKVQMMDLKVFNSENKTTFLPPKQNILLDNHDIRSLTSDIEFSLPEGWKKHGRTGVATPEGLKFPNKAKALEYLKNKGGSHAIIEALKKAYIAEGYTREKLPLGWIGKGDSGGKYFFFAPDGTACASKAKAKAHLVLTGGSLSDQAMFEDFISYVPKRNNRSYEAECNESVLRTNMQYNSEPLSTRAQESQITFMADQINSTYGREFTSNLRFGTPFSESELVSSPVDYEMKQTLDIKLDGDAASTNIINEQSLSTFYESDIESSSVNSYEDYGVTTHSSHIDRFTPQSSNFESVGFKTSNLQLSPTKNSIDKYYSSNSDYESGKQYNEKFFSEQTSRFNEENSESYASTEDKVSLFNKLPGMVGWTSLGSSTGMESPQGIKFKSKSKALQYLIKNEGSQETIEALKCLMVEDGWSIDNLPPNWIGKGFSSNKYYFIAEDGTALHGKAKAMAHITQFSKFDYSHRKKYHRMIEDFMVSKTAKSYVEQHNMSFDHNSKEVKYEEQKDVLMQADYYTWKVSEYLPNGWLCQDTTDKIVSVKAPDGTKFQSYNDIVEFMKKSNYSQTAIDMLLLYPDGRKTSNYMVLDSDWISNKYLPLGWKCKIKDNTRHIYVRPPELNKILKTYKAVASYMERSERYSQKDIDRFFLYPDGKRRLVSTTSGSEATNSYKSTPTISSNYVDNGEQGYEFGVNGVRDAYQNWEWKANDYLPEGWMSRDNLEGSNVISLLSPGGDIVSSYKAATDLMVSDSRYTPEDLEKLHFYMNGLNRREESGFGNLSERSNKVWETNEYLPRDWKCVNTKESSNMIEIMSAEGTILKSYEDAVQYMKDRNFRYHPTDIDQLYRYPDGIDHRYDLAGDKEFNKKRSLESAFSLTSSTETDLFLDEQLTAVNTLELESSSKRLKTNFEDIEEDLDVSCEEQRNNVFDNSVRNIVAAIPEVNLSDSDSSSSGESSSEGTGKSSLAVSRLSVNNKVPDVSFEGKIELEGNNVQEDQVNNEELSDDEIDSDFSSD